jgi:hypothetical protein
MDNQKANRESTIQQCHIGNRELTLPSRDSSNIKSKSESDDNLAVFDTGADVIVFSSADELLLINVTYFDRDHPSPIELIMADSVTKLAVTGMG